ncbi:MAG: sterol desaturase family protein [Pseudomonadota bacterium]
MWGTATTSSTPYFNISVANRFGPMDGFWTVFFHLPLAFAGFHPLLIIFCELVVLQYQTFLHTETIRKLPRPIEWIMNTPSHHRVHHGSNPDYIDRNYGGVFIVWDRLFGSFAEEKEPVVYGLVRPEESINPLAVFFRGFTRLFEKMGEARGLGAKLACLIAPPEWSPAKRGGERQAG